MRDPHVQVIHYEIASGEGVFYTEPEPFSFSNDLGDFVLENEKLRIIPSEHFPDEEQVRGAIEPFLRSWEIYVDLSQHRGMIRFKFSRVELIDLNPPPPGTTQVVHARCVSTASFGGSASIQIGCRRYPEPPRVFQATSDVQIGHRRWLGFHAGKEPLQAMAYFVLTLIEGAASGRVNAARIFQIDLDVLKKIGEFSSTRGDETTARKAGHGSAFHDLLPSERDWLEEAVRRVIRRLGEHASGAPLGLISLRDLPQI